MSTVQVNRVVDSQGGVLAPISSVMRNRIINGQMTIDQRNAGASVTPTADATYTLDRWMVRLSQSSKFSVQQNAGSVTPPVGFTNYLGATSLASTSLSAGDFFAIEQRIEGYNFADLGWGTANAKTITISFWVRSSLTGTFGGALNNGSFNRVYPFSYTISSANTWEQKSITIAGDTTGTWLTTNGVGVFVGFGLGVGTTYSGTAGSWQGSGLLSATGATSVVGTNGATFYITGVQLEKGTQATSFEYRQYGTELALCQRYYEKTYNQSVVPGTATDNGTNWTESGINSTTNYISMPVLWKVTKRTAPTITFYDRAGTSGVASYINTDANGKSITASMLSDDRGRFFSDNSSSKAGVVFQFTASAEL